MKRTLSELANTLRGTVVGDNTVAVCQLSPIDNILPGSLVFAEGADNLQKAEQSEAAAILVSPSVSSSPKALIQVENPLKAFIQLIEIFHPQPRFIPGVHPTAVIAEGVKIGRDAYIGPYVVIGADSSVGDSAVLKGHNHIGRGVRIGNESCLNPHVTVYDNCQLGDRVIIHAGTVIGSDGFGYTYMDGQHLKIPHAGNVTIEDDVEIGANTVIDRATLGATRIGAGSKIDNLVQVAHSVQLGKQNILCAFTGIAGSTTSGDRVIFAANVGVSDHVRIDNDVVLGARAGVPPRKHLKAGAVYLGSPARPKDKAIEHELSVSRIPGLKKNIQRMQERIETLTKRLAEFQGQLEEN